MFKPCFLIPVYNHGCALPATIAQLKKYDLPCVLVDDGSDKQCRSVIENLVAAEPWLHLVTHERNLGKGAAIKTGMRRAHTLSYSHALQIDADGQHNTDDIPRFLEHARRQPEALITGYPVFDRSAPRSRVYGRYATHIWVWINCLSLAVKDTMCGFRVYPVAPINNLLLRQPVGDRMDFDIEIMVRSVWHGLKIVNLETQVFYPEGGISHFRGIRDNALISAMHARLFLGMLWRIPRLLMRKLA